MVHWLPCSIYEKPNLFQQPFFKMSFVCWILFLILEIAPSLGRIPTTITFRRGCFSLCYIIWLIYIIVHVVCSAKYRCHRDRSRQMHIFCPPQNVLCAITTYTTVNCVERLQVVVPHAGISSKVRHNGVT